MQGDFRYISDLISDFFKRRQTRQRLVHMDACDMSGWENWFQLEFAHFLDHHPSGPEWERESHLEYDYRRERKRWYCQPDFLIRKKGWQQGRYAVLEVKLKAEFPACLSGMVDDLYKVRRIRGSQLDVRSAWALGIHRYSPDRATVELIRDRIAGTCQRRLKTDPFWA